MVVQQKVHTKLAWGPEVKGLPLREDATETWIYSKGARSEYVTLSESKYVALHPTLVEVVGHIMQLSRPRGGLGYRLLGAKLVGGNNDLENVLASQKCS